MSETHYTKFLLDIKDKNIILDDQFPPTTKKQKNGTLIKQIFFRSITPMITCRCGNQTNRLHDYRTVKIKHYSCGTQPAVLVIRKKRFVCSHCNARITESLSFVKKHCFISQNIKQSIAVELRKFKNMKIIAEELNVSHTTIRRVLNSFLSIKRKISLPRVLAFDEFKANTYAGKYACILTDIENKCIVDILPDRKKYYLIKYFDRFSPEERAKVEYVVMDMWDTYKDIVELYFPNAQIVSDKFHYVRLIGQVLMGARIQASKRLPENKANHLKLYWRLIQKRTKDLNIVDFKRFHFKRGFFTEAMVVDTLMSYDSQLDHVYDAYQEFLTICNMHDFQSQVLKLDEWIKRYREDTYQPLAIAAQSIEKWELGILVSFYTGYSNGYTEGINNKIKVIKRIGFGMRNFLNFRTRILLSVNIL